MALDKQRILSELGSVVNQLQSADCGCMGKLLSNPNQGGTSMGHPLPTCGGCRRSCCHGHGYNNGHGATCAGESHSHMNQSCMGRCNPPKLYADTYSYLNQNLMQPVIKEVYNDLKNITPANTITNNPLANQMGLSPQGNPMIKSNIENAIGQNQMPMDTMRGQDTMQHMAPATTGNCNFPVMNNTNAQMNHMEGMGPQIVNMITGDSSAKPDNVNTQNRQLTGPMSIDSSQSPHGNVGVTPLNAPLGTNYNQYGSYNIGMPNLDQGNSGIQMQNVTGQYQSNVYRAENGQAQNSTMPYNRSAINTNSIPQQMTTHNNPYGQHSPGVTKFNKMFPGVMQGLGGDLGFDPMAIAIQMNPANQQKAAIDSMNKLMNNNDLGKVFDTKSTASKMQPATAVPNASAKSFVKPTAVANEAQQNISPSRNQNFVPANQIGYQQIAAVQQNPELEGSKSQYMRQQQAYMAFTGTPEMHQPQASPLKMEEQNQNQQHEQQQMIEPNTGAIITQPMFPRDNCAASHTQILPQTPTQTQNTNQGQNLLKEPIYPVDTSKNRHPDANPQKYNQYNTLGQPIEMLPAEIYQTPEMSLPQTLSPQSIMTNNNQLKYSNVKSTVSKTSLMGNRPIGKTPSRNQLQHIYNQYKGSQSYTQQNIGSSQGATYSEGRLNVAKTNGNSANQAPIERIGGDSIVTNQVINKQDTNKIEQMGDVPPANKYQGDVKDIPMNQTKCRNGLQDMIYPSYASAAWSFHGNNNPSFSDGYRFRSRRNRN